MIVDDILAARYYRANENSFADVCARVSQAIGENETETKEFYDAMVNLEFLPNSPTLMNAGTKLGQLSACFTLPVNDSISEIFDTIKYGALIHQSGGGTGYNFSNIRAEGSPVKSTCGIASGPVSFMRVFDAATNVIKQGGRRRGANMGILNVWHTDIMKFIRCKQTEGEISNFNISVMVNDDFMKKVFTKCGNDVWIKDNAGNEITVKDIWDAIVDGIWKNGEPGILFYDTINQYNPTPALGNIDTTNPCGEQPLLPFESCVLGSINLAKFVFVQKKSDDVTLYGIDREKLWKTVRMAVRFLDAVITKNKFPIEQIKENTLRTRKIGLGLMGVHDALLQLKIPYDDEDARVYIEDIMKYIQEIAVTESRNLAAIHGSYPAFPQSVRAYRKEEPIRNAALTTIAPTGSISLLAGCSSGIEPVFSYVYTRRNTVGKTFTMVHPFFESELRRVITNMKLPESRADDVINHMRACGTIQDIEWLPIDFKQLFKTALDIHWKDHVMMQAAAQRHVDASISKTINMRAEATREDISAAILLAWKEGIKGVTIYRNGSRTDAVLTLDQPEKSEEIVENTVKLPVQRPRALQGITYLANSGCCKLYVTVNLQNNQPYEVFLQTAGSGGCIATINALARCISTGLKMGIPYTKFVNQFAKVNCVSAQKNHESDGKSCADVIGKCIAKAAESIR